ncbi:MAG: hypothetical protein PGMFKBFP_02398 [Anaerolineales bacterium]|nr:hypothetical protein [Anaerolineales bacterium]
MPGAGGVLLFTTVSIVPSPSVSKNNRYVMFRFEPEQESVAVIVSAASPSHRSCDSVPLSHQYGWFHNRLSFDV